MQDKYFIKSNWRVDRTKSQKYENYPNVCFRNYHMIARAAVWHHITMINF